MLPTTAVAHTSPALSTDFEARVQGFRPPAPGLAARVLGSDQRLELRVPPGRVVVVLGVEHEPFLRFSSTGVEANLASPTAVSARVIASADAVAAPAARWRRVAGGHVFAWHESRLRPVASVSDSSSRPRRVAVWSIPLIMDGHDARVEGSEWHANRPPLWPWLAAGALALALSAVAARRLSRQTLRRIAVPLTALAVGTLIAGWAGILFVDGAASIGVLLALAAAVASALGLAALLSAATGTARVGAAALIGVLSMTLALPELSVFMHGYVLSALSGTLARLAAEAALVSGASVAILCVPSVLEFFDALDPLRQPARS